MMVIRSRAGAPALGLLSVFAAALALGTFPLSLPAQESAPARPKAAAKERDPSRRVPPFFGQVGLTPDQKEEIYKVRARHQAKIDDLQQQIKAAQEAMLAECEQVLNDTQRSLLVTRREAAAKARAAKAVKPAPGATPAAKPGN